MHLHLIIIGILLLALAFIHIVFPKYFNWGRELSSLSLINRQMMVVHTFFIAVTLFLMGLLCLTSANDIINTSLGKKVSFGFGIFWALRLLIQFFGYAPELWKGKSFETVVHIVFIFLWSYLTFVFFAIAFN